MLHSLLRPTKSLPVADYAPNPWLIYVLPRYYNALQIYHQVQFRGAIKTSRKGWIYKPWSGKKSQNSKEISDRNSTLKNSPDPNGGNKSIMDNKILYLDPRSLNESLPIFVYHYIFVLRFRHSCTHEFIHLPTSCYARVSTCDPVLLDPLVYFGWSQHRKTLYFLELKNWHKR